MVDSILNFPNIRGGKKLIYPQIKMPLTGISDFSNRSKESSLFRELDQICSRHNGCWNGEAEKYLLDHAEKIDVE